MKYTKHRVLLLAALLALSALAGCKEASGAAGPDSLIGVWAGEGADKVYTSLLDSALEPDTLIFFDDGTFQVHYSEHILTGSYDSYTSRSESGTYAIEGGQLTLTYADMAAPVEYTVSGSTLTLTYEGGALVFEKDGEPPERFVELDLSGFQDDAGYFCPKQTAWFVSADELERDVGKRALGFYRSRGLDTGKTEGDYYAENAVSWDGCPGGVTHEIHGEGLTGITYVFSDSESDLDAVYDGILAKITELYGEPARFEPSPNKSANLESEKWQTERDGLRASGLGVRKMIIDGKTVEVAVLLSLAAPL